MPNISIRTEKAYLANNITWLSFLMGSSLLVFYAALIMGAGVLFILRGSLNLANTALSALIAALFFFVAGRKILSFNFRWLLTGFVLTTLLVILPVIISGWFYDLSWDGQDYHQRAILELENSWNPIFTVQQPEPLYYNLWLNHYPKGPWIAAASTNQVTGNLESGKVVNLWLIAAVMLIAFSLFRTVQLKAAFSIFVAVLLALNPVSVYQSFSYYVDGQVASIITVLILLFLFLIIPSLRFQPKIILIALTAALIISLNIKFTGTVYILIITIALLSIQIAMSASRPLFKSTLAVVLTGLIAGFLVAGFQPYVTNSLRNANPLYPTLGGKEYDHKSLIQIQMPEDFKSKNSLEKLFLSNFSPPMNGILGQVRPQFPFSVTKNQIKEYWSADIRVGGFGPWFGASVILSGIVAILLWTEKSRYRMLTFLLVGIILLSALVNPESWWARYSPQLWLIPVVILAGGLFSRRISTRLPAYVLMLVLFANIFMVSGYYVYSSIRNTRQAQGLFQRLADRNDSLLVYYGKLEMVRVKLDQWQLNYTAVDDFDNLRCPRKLIPFVFYSKGNCSK